MQPIEINKHQFFKIELLEVPLTYKATILGYIPQVILSGRSINDGMGSFIASQVIKELIKNGICIKGSIVTVLGFTFKENVPDIRNTRVIDIVRELQEYGVNVQVFDPLSSAHEIQSEYNLTVSDNEYQMQSAQAVILAVPHKYFLDKNWEYISNLLNNKTGVVIDVKGKLDRNQIPENISLWRL